MDNNPLSGIKIGSTVSALDGSFSAPVINGNISKINSIGYSEKSMTGHSSYVYTDSMNQGSLGVSGSYGVSGISKVSASVTGYVGNSKASSDKTISVDYNIKATAGIEYIFFDNLSAEDLINALARGPKQDLIAAMELYTKLDQELKASNLTALNVLQDTTKYSELNTQLQNWITSTQRFFKNYGDGVVVGVLWGGYGAVSMNMTSKSDQSIWKYGGSASFSYSGIGASVSVKATYDGANSSSTADVDVACKSFHSGNFIKDQVDSWFNQVSGQSFEALANVSVLDKAPDLSNGQPAPEIPAFVTPKSEPSVADKIGKIKNLDGLKAFAQASAFDKAKKTNPKLTLDEFLTQSEQKSDVKILEKTRSDVAENNISVKDAITQTEQPQDVKAALANLSTNLTESLIAVPGAQPTPPQATTPTTQGSNPVDLPRITKDPTDDYAPLGVWVAKWTDLFPWLATGFLNSVESDGTVSDKLRYQTMLQDLSTLSSIYFIADASGVKPVGFEAVEMAREFSNAQATLLTLNGKPDAIGQVYHNHLSEDSRKIYDLWDNIKYLRGAELGLGLLTNDNKTLGDPTADNSSSFTKSDCAFNAQDKNYVAFSQVKKLLPCLYPDGRISLFGPHGGELNKTTSENLTFGGEEPKFFSAKNTGRDFCLECDDSTIKVYPIPFSAAQGAGVDWKGMSVSTNLSANMGLKNQLELVQAQLSGLKAWSLSSDTWQSDWSGSDVYHQREIPTQYIGLIAEQGNIFSKQ
ncbi:hypothetical protein [Pseudoalteromonas rubra]|uniref:Uncharacterized protein n=1 Tax=Pseudoalteromonas rubra TaxID=43658 RepID=A0A0U3GWS2_9GAMM|nr:hypothetical protein [Pseudoalteromonas rubra]ALU43571.1 hypothetical protein AT705_11795 [Pseudoalteromonas rubra]